MNCGVCGGGEIHPPFSRTENYGECDDISSLSLSLSFSVILSLYIVSSVM